MSISKEDIAVLGQAISDASNYGQPRKIGIAEYKACTPFNPSGEERKEHLARPVFQNGFRIDETFVDDEQIALLNSLPPGRYNNRKWEVILRNGENGDTSLEIRFPNATVAQRLDLKNEARTFTEMLHKIIAEHKDRELAEDKRIAERASRGAARS